VFDYVRVGSCVIDIMWDVDSMWLISRVIDITCWITCDYDYVLECVCYRLSVIDSMCDCDYAWL